MHTLEDKHTQRISSLENSSQSATMAGSSVFDHNVLMHFDQKFTIYHPLLLVSPKLGLQCTYYYHTKSLQGGRRAISLSKASTINFSMLYFTY